MVSLVKPMQDGALVEVGLVGREGFVGLAAVLGSDLHAVEQMVQIAGAALRVGAASRCARSLPEARFFRRGCFVMPTLLFAQYPRPRRATVRHTVQERLARWLLMARDRIDDDVVPLQSRASFDDAGHAPAGH